MYDAGSKVLFPMYEAGSKVLFPMYEAGSKVLFICMKLVLKSFSYA